MNSLKTSIFLCSYRRDFPYLEWCLRSIKKFAQGFCEVVIVVPDGQVGECEQIASAAGQNVRVESEPEWPGMGMIQHMNQIFHADLFCIDADYVLHTDSDCIFTGPVSPRDYFEGAKPVLWHAPYDIVCREVPQLRAWQHGAEMALGFRPTEETMRRHPAVHYAKTYRRTRQCIEAHCGSSCEFFMRKQKNAYPQSLSEFNVLGAVAWRYFHDEYHWVSTAKHLPKNDKLFQAWSHSPIDQPQQAPWGEKVVPLDFFKKKLA